MKQEIERKFLVTGDAWRSLARTGLACRQGYLSSSTDATVRVRLIGGKGFLTIKGRTKGISRAEMEYEIPATDAEYMLDHLCGTRIVSKTRYVLNINGLKWEVDEFHGAHLGLVLVEIELEYEDQPIDLPEWVGEEVSCDYHYTNVFLASHSHKRES